jgi:hypothetical protein
MFLYMTCSFDAAFQQWKVVVLAWNFLHRSTMLLCKKYPLKVQWQWKIKSGKSNTDILKWTWGRTIMIVETRCSKYVQTGCTHINTGRVLGIKVGRAWFWTLTFTGCHCFTFVTPMPSLVLCLNVFTIYIWRTYTVRLNWHFAVSLSGAAVTECPGWFRIFMR